MRGSLKTVLGFVLLGFTGSSVFGDCHCQRAPESETTHWGGNMRIEVEQKSTLKMLHGRVEYDGKPLGNALVEVFAKDGHIPSGLDGRSEQKRLAACKTKNDGEFCFKDLPSGKYEIRSSIDTGWDVTYVVLTVDTKKGKNRRLHLPMNVGT